MKKSFLVIVLSLFCMFPHAEAQTIDKANSSYLKFKSLQSEGNNEQGMYAALYQCYEDYAAVLKHATVNTPEYIQAKKTLRELYPLLQNGAIYNSSRGNQNNALLLGQAFMDIPLMKAFEGESFVRNDYFPTMAYFAASSTYNRGDYARAIKYFKVYLSTNEQKNRKNVYIYMAKACMNIKDYDLAASVMNEACDNYPQDFQMLSHAINNCIERNDNANLQPLVTRALAMRPNDKTLLNIQGKLYEDTQDFQKALNIYTQLLRSNPSSITVNRHLATNYYNLGVISYNKASMETDEKTAKQYSRQANEYFTAAAGTLENIVANDPSAIKYIQALGVAYSCMGDNGKLAAVNTKLSMLGSKTVEANATPTLITSGNNSAVASSNASGNLALASTPSTGSNVSSATPSTPSNETPRYSVYAKEYVETQLRKWQEKDPYETVAEYKVRVTEETRIAKVADLKKAAENEYIKTYTRNIRFSDMVLKPYDAENRVFLIESEFGELIVPVPREHNKAKVFESSWNGMQFKSPEFYINNDKLTLASLTFVTPSGDTYRYDGDKNLNYVETVVDVSFDPIASDMFAQNSVQHSGGSHVKRQSVKVGTIKSDVDMNIPTNKKSNNNTFAVIIANENYSMVAGVPMALNDGVTFSEYCKKTLGLPDKNVRLYQDASFGVMIRAMRDIKDIASAFSGDIQVIFYYAGHGIPNEATKDAFLLPIDADGMQTEGCYSLNRLYGELGALNAKSVVVFLDACFSGANRDGNMLASARGVALKAKKETPKGNMVIFSAASGEETAFPYKEKGHGLFTYYLLKKLQESEGDATLQELSEYVTANVKQQSVVVNRKSQTPSVTPSSSMLEDWQDLKLNGK